jgi:DNA polymerase-3 subunit gamma/tau
MDAASNRGIDDIRDLRDKVHFSPVEGRMKVYIVDEVHMLTSEAFNALLKTLEEPPAHAIFVLATTEPHKVPATILSRCQRFDFRRPSVPEVVSVLAGIAAQEGIEAAEASLTVIARAAGGSFRDAIGILDQLSTYSGGAITLQQTLDMLGLVQQDLLFEMVDLVHERDTRSALLFVERLSQGATDYAQFIKDLLGHLRDLYVVKHTGEVPSSIAMTEEQQQVLRSQSGRVSTAEMVAFIDLLGEAMRSVRQGSDARLELELVLIKMTATRAPGGSGETVRRVDIQAPARDLQAPARQGPPQREATRHEPARGPEPPKEAATPRSSQPAPPEADEDVPEDQTADSTLIEIPVPGDGETGVTPAGADIDHFRRAWPLILEAVKKRQVGLHAVLAEGRPERVEGETLFIKFPAGYKFQADMVGRGDNPRVITEALREITGRELKVSARVAIQESPEPESREEDARILSRDELLQVLKQEFDASVIDDGPAR